MSAEQKWRVNVPVGAVMTSSSRVMHFPPALVILALAVSVNLRAATVNFGTSRSLTSSVTAPTTTTIFFLQNITISKIVGHFLTMKHLLVLKMLDDLRDWKWWSVSSWRNESSQHGLAESGFSSSAQESEQLFYQKKRDETKDLKRLTLIRRWKYRLSLLVFTLFEFLILPLLTRSIPYHQKHLELALPLKLLDLEL